MAAGEEDDSDEDGWDIGVVRREPKVGLSLSAAGALGLGPTAGGRGSRGWGDGQALPEGGGLGLKWR